MSLQLTAQLMKQNQATENFLLVRFGFPAETECCDDDGCVGLFIMMFGFGWCGAHSGGVFVFVGAWTPHIIIIRLLCLRYQLSPWPWKTVNQTIISIAFYWLRERSFSSHTTNYWRVRTSSHELNAQNLFTFPVSVEPVLWHAAAGKTTTEPINLKSSDVKRLGVQCDNW